MKFEIDRRTGEYVPKKDENIYFGGSQGGGLIVDDKKNNMKFIVERDGTITWLFSTRKDTHLYDVRDARIIADRVMRKFGNEHKYTDYKAFARNMKAVWESLLPTFEDFLNECGCEENDMEEEE